MSKDMEVEIELLLEVETEKEDKITKLKKEYQILNEKCDQVLTLIRNRKSRKVKAS